MEREEEGRKRRSKRGIQRQQEGENERRKNGENMVRKEGFRTEMCDKEGKREGVRKR